MTDFSDFFPLFGKNEADIRAEMDARANVGLMPDDPEWVDTRAGGFFWLSTQPTVVGLAAAYSRMNEAAAAGIISTSWESYLDLHADGFGENRKVATKATGQVTFTGTAGSLIGTGVEVAPTQTDPDVEPPIFVTTQSGTIPGVAPATGSVTLTVEAEDEGVSGNVAAGSVDQLLTGVAGISDVTNANPIGGGTEVESDPALKVRLEQLFQGKGSGTQADYVRWALDEPGVGRVTIIPLWAGDGTVLVIVMDEEGRAVDAPIVTSLQTRLDPVSGTGAGQAPIDHAVTVRTVVEVPIVTSAHVTFEPGYSLDPAGTIGLREQLKEAVGDYINSLEAGEDVIYNHVRAAYFTVEGVLDVTTLTVNGGTADIAISAATNPPEVATIDIENDVDFV